MVVKTFFVLDNHFMAKDIRVEFGRIIRSLRKQHRLTQEELADRAGISTKYLQNLEGKKPKTASIITIEKLAKAFGITISQLLKF